MNNIYDCVVVGCGGIGSAALYFAARKGWKVAGIDRFPIGHARGSSHGKTRIIRQAYFEHPDYVPLLRDAYALWEDLESISGQTLLQKTGLLQVGHPEGPIISNILKAARHHHLSLVELGAEQLSKNYPVFHCRKDDVGLLETVGGFLRVEKCVHAFATAALDQGAEWMQCGVRGVERCQNTFKIVTDSEVVHAKRLIVAAGAWASDLLPEVKNLLKVVAKHQHWFQIADSRLSLNENCPTFFFETDQGYFYGFPGFDPEGVKVAEHSGGEPVPDPLNVERGICQADLQRVQDFTQQYFNSARAVHREHSVCMYTVSPDEHFIVDSPQPGLAIACGMSGHGFKFAPIIGSALVELTEGKARDDMAFLKLNRFNNGV